ncbi:MAG: class I SAM-dependent methyltransferase [Oligoflexales bacterium]
MDEKYLSLMVDLHRNNDRQGPGSKEITEKALSFFKPPSSKKIKVADIGCGTGASTLQIAHTLNADIIAVDFVSEFTEILKGRAKEKKLSIVTLVCPMEELPFKDNAFDLIWSEGAIYNMGFEKGVNACRKFLKPGGVLAVSEITWITAYRPKELEDYWVSEYPEIATSSTKIKILEQAGYSPIAYMVLPEVCWLENYYYPLKARLPKFLEANRDNEIAGNIAESEQKERDLYEKYKAFYSYGFYIAKKVENMGETSY